MAVDVGVGDPRKIESGNDCKGVAVITAIFRSIEQADTLIELLAQRNGECKGRQDEADAVKSSNSLCKCRQAKGDAIIVEEIKAVNCHLRNLITELMSQLESKDRKVLMLKERLVQLEEEHARLKHDNNSEASSSSASSANSRSKEDDEG